MQGASLISGMSQKEFVRGRQLNSLKCPSGLNVLCPLTAFMC